MIRALELFGVYADHNTQHAIIYEWVTIMDWIDLLFKKSPGHHLTSGAIMQIIQTVFSYDKCGGADKSFPGLKIFYHSSYGAFIVTFKQLVTFNFGIH